jgi:tripartite-type tricarboxylate transporter receptor subunit TctC
MTSRRLFLATAVFATAFAGVAMAQDPAASYPDKPVRLIAGSSPGGTADLVARLIADNLSKKLNGRFVVENVPGNSGGIASVQVARAAPDGYTLMLAAINSHAILPALNKTLQYDPIKDFEHVSVISTSPNLLMANPKTGVKTIADLIAALKKDPTKYNYGTGGIGTSQHLAMEIFLQATGTKATHIPYAGSGQLLNALVGGTVDIAFDTMTTGIGHVRQGNLVGLGVSSKQRNDAAPDMPPVADVVPGFDVVAWNAVLAPAKTPAPIVDKLSKAIAEILRTPEVVERLKQMGTTPVGGTPAETRAFIAADIKKFDDIVKAANIKAE